MTPEQKKEIVILAKNVSHQYDLFNLTDDAVINLQKSVNVARSNILNELEVRYGTGTWSEDRALRVMDELDRLNLGLANRLGKDLNETYKSVFNMSLLVHNNILSFDGSATNVNTVAMSSKQIKSYLEKTTLGGQFLNDWVDKVLKDNVNDIRNEIISGRLKGSGYPKIVNSIKDKYSELNRKEIIALTRTYVQGANVEAMMDVYRENTDIIKGVRWTATLESGFKSKGRGTCIRCAGLDGREFPLDDVPPCPLHVNCFIDNQIPIYTSKGDKPIGKIKVGDLVLTHKGRFRKVTQLIFTPKQIVNVVKIHTNMKIKPLIVTEDHPSMVNGKWTNSKDISIGDNIRIRANRCKRCDKLIPFSRKYCSHSCLNKERILKNHNGEYEFIDVCVTKVEHYRLKKSRTLYNFSVEEDESYIANGYLVHNCRCFLVPVTRTWKELGLPEFEEFDKAQRPAKIVKDLNIDTGRRNYIKSVTFEKGNYGEWFNKQSKEFKINAVGPTREKLIRDGKLTFWDLTDPKTGKQFTLRELGFDFKGQRIKGISKKGESPPPYPTTKFKGKDTSIQKISKLNIPEVPQIKKPSKMKDAAIFAQELSKGNVTDKYIKDSEKLLDYMKSSKDISKINELSKSIRNAKTMINSKSLKYKNLLKLEDEAMLISSTKWDSTRLKNKKLEIFSSLLDIQPGINVTKATRNKWSEISNFFGIDILTKLKQNSIKAKIFNTVPRTEKYGYDKVTKTIVISKRDKISKIVHMFSHAIDDSFGGLGGNWNNNEFVTINDSNKLLNEFWRIVEKSGKGNRIKKTFNNGLGSYWLGNWVGTYDSRIYKNVGPIVEWFAVNVERFSEYKLRLNSYKNMLLSLQKELDQNIKSFGYENIITKRTERKLDLVKKEGKQNWALRQSKWDKVKIMYPDLADFIETKINTDYTRDDLISILEGNKK